MDSAQDLRARIVARCRAGEVALVVGASIARHADALALLGRVPARVWTTDAGDAVARAIASASPAHWPEARVVTVEHDTRLDARQRHVLRLLGDAEAGTALASAEAVRRVYAPGSRARGLLADLYHEGCLLFVGFEPGDADLRLLLERVLAAFEPPAAGATHLFVGAVDADLAAEHHLALVDATPAAFLAELVADCEAEGLSLARGRPAPDDLEGWGARLAEDPGDPEAHAALVALEKGARDGGRADRLVDVLLLRVEHEGEPAARAAALRELARVFETDVGDLPRAFTALTTAMKEDPTDEALVAEAERLAAETDGWGELVADLSEAVPHIKDRRVAAAHWVRLGRWYREKLRHDDYAAASYREALKLDAGRADARAGLADLHRRQQRWGELAEELAAWAALEPDGAQKVALYAELAELQEGALASPARAIDAYETLLAAAPAHEDALTALERLYRRGEAWGKLAAILERRAALAEGGDLARAAALRKELARLRAEKLGDVEGAIARYAAALDVDPGDREALYGLLRLYERAGRTDDQLAILERLADVGSEGERPALLRRLAAAVVEREGGAARAIRAYETLLTLEPAAPDAHRSLERLYRAEHMWDAMVGLLERRIAAAPSPPERAELWQALGRLHEQELFDPHRAIDAYEHAAELAPESAPTFAAIARLAKRLEAWDRALAAVERQAELTAAPFAADLWFAAAELAGKRLRDEAGAEARLGRALDADPGHVSTLLALVDQARRRGDFARAAALMLDAEKSSQNRLERVALLFDAAVLTDDKLGRHEAAALLCSRVLVLDPDHVEAGRRLADHHVARQDWVQAEPVLAMLARKATDPLEIARRHTQLGDAAEALGRLDKAGKHYATAVAADPQLLPAALGLARVHVARREHALADRALRDILARHRPALAQGQVIDIWETIGRGARALGDPAAAEAAFRAALELDPGRRSALREIVELAALRGDWKSAVQGKREALEGATEEERLRLLEEIGDLTAQKLGDPVAALGVYLEALVLRPRASALLHKVLEIYTDAHEWRRAIEIVDRLADIERDPAVRAKLHYTSALIARDELDLPEEAVTRMGRALDDAPGMEKAFEAIEALLGEREDWKGLVRAYTAMLRRLGDAATTAQQLYLWTRLGDVARDKLGDTRAAMAAYEVASALEPANIGRHEQLAALYLAAGASHDEKAAAELQLLVRRFPDRLELYHQLFDLYAHGGQRDRAFCLAQALAFLGQAEEAERRFAESHAPKKLVQARRRLTEELWQKNILHAREDRLMNGIFALLMGSLAATTAQPHGALALSPREQSGADDPHPLARIYRYVVQVLGIQPAPELYLKAGREPGIQAANVAEKGVLTPAVVIGLPPDARRGDGEAAFDVGKKLAYFRPERYVYYALATVPKLEAAFAAALAASGAGAAKEPEVEKLVSHFKRTVPASVLEHVGALARKHPAAASGNGAVSAAVAGWITATDLTANRVGLILANDLETAARQIATEKATATSLSAKERLRDLLAFAASEDYFVVRRHLGLEVQA